MGAAYATGCLNIFRCRLGLPYYGHEAESGHIQSDLDHVGGETHVNGPGILRAVPSHEELLKYFRNLAALHTARQLAVGVDEPSWIVTCVGADFQPVPHGIEVVGDVRANEGRCVPEFAETVEVGHQRPVWIELFGS